MAVPTDVKIEFPECGQKGRASNAALTGDSPDKSVAVFQKEEELKEQSKDTQKYVVYKYRWVVLFCYSLIKFSSSAIYGLFVPFSMFIQDTYGISHVFIVLTSYTFNGLYPFASFFFADPIIQAYGPGISLVIAVLGMLSCLWLRTLLNQWIYFINFASLIASITDPLQHNIISLVGTNWFPMSQQVCALTCISVFSILGPVAGSFYSLVFIKTSIEDREEAQEMMFKATLYLAITYTCIYIPCIVLFRGKPKHPPCPASTTPKLESTKTIKEKMMMLLTNWNYMCLLIIDVIQLVLISCIGGNISPLLEKNGIDDPTVIVTVGSAFILCGLLGAGINALIMNKRNWFKGVLVTCMGGMTISYFFSFLVFKLKNSVLSIIFPGLLGFFEIPLRAHNIAFMCEVAYPVSKELKVSFTQAKP